MKSVSAKQLRLDLPQILENVSRGEEYVIIYRSKPVGEIVPLRSRRKGAKNKTLMDLISSPLEEVKFPKGKSSVHLIREDRD